MRDLIVHEEVREALARGRGVVALETSVIGQGLPEPRNRECVRRMDGAIRARGAVPAWIAVADGAVRVGVDADVLDRMATPGSARKVARRDVPAAVAARALGATTVSATIHAAHLAGIAIGATGGIGGVHRPTPDGARDVSADLLELARTPVLLVCSGAKSIIDPVATADHLEELGVALVGYRVDLLPYFLAREAPVRLEHRVDDPAAAAAIAVAGRTTGATGATLLCNPVPAGAALDASSVEEAVVAAEAEAAAAGIGGKARTPFLLGRIAEHSGGQSLEANLALLEDNAAVAADVAVAFAALEPGSPSGPAPSGARSSRSPS